MKWTQKDLEAMQADEEYDNLKAEGFKSEFHKRVTEEAGETYTQKYNRRHYTPGGRFGE